MLAVCPVQKWAGALPTKKPAIVPASDRSTGTEPDSSWMKNRSSSSCLMMPMMVLLSSTIPSSALTSVSCTPHQPVRTSGAQSATRIQQHCRPGMRSSQPEQLYFAALVLQFYLNH